MYCIQWGLFAYVLSCVGNGANTKSNAVQQMRKGCNSTFFVLHKSGFFAHVLSCVRNCAKSNAVRKMRKGCNSTFLYCINQDSLLVYCHVWETVQIQNTMQYNKWEKAVVVLFVLHKSGLFAYVLSCVGNCADTKSSAVHKWEKAITVLCFVLPTMRTLCLCTVLCEKLWKYKVKCSTTNEKRL